jgi:hypothetical protein
MLKPNRKSQQFFYKYGEILATRKPKETPIFTHFEKN